MNDLDQIQPEEATVINKKLKKPARNLMIVIIVLLAIAVLGVYYWQHMEVTKANSATSALSDKNKTLSDQITTLRSENTKNEAIIKSYGVTTTPTNEVVPIISMPTQEDLTVSPLSAGYVNPDGTVTAGGSWYGVRLTLTNPSSKPISLVVKNFALKDILDNTYNIYGFSGASTLPDGWGANTLQDQTINAGSSVTGDLIFQMANKNLVNYILVNGSKTYSIKATF